MDLSIIILNYKTKELVEKNVSSIEHSCLNIAHEIIIIDNCSPDNSYEVLSRKYPGYTVRKTQKNVGFAAGMNIGIRQAKGRYILIANPDIQFGPKIIESMVEYMDEHREIGLLGPKLLNPDGTIQWSCLHFPSFFTPIFRRTVLGHFSFAKKHIASYLMKDHDHKTIQPVDWMIGACMMARKKAINSVGLFDEKYFLYIEDTDWCRRFWKKGYHVVYYPREVVIHNHPRLSAKRRGLRSLFDYPTRLHLKSWIVYLKKYKCKKFQPTQYL